MRAPMKVERGGTPAPMSQLQNQAQETGIFIEAGKKLKVDPKLLIAELVALGYCVLKRGKEPQLLHVDHQGIIEQVADPGILGPAIEPTVHTAAEKRAWFDYTCGDPFSKGFLNHLPELSGDFLEDTAKDIYFPFLNGIVHVTAKSIKLAPYDRGRMVWRTHIRPREINLKAGNKKCMYDAFIRNLAGKDNILHVQWALGYLLHDYFNPDLARVVLLYDDAATRGNHGRTGKDLLLASIEQMRRTTVIDARNMQKGDNPYLFGGVTEDTQFLKISDPKYFGIFSDLFNRVQGLFPVNQKYKTEVYLKHTPKIAISSNIMFNADNTSEKERQFPIILKPFYRDLGVAQPIRHVHGKLFFKDWTPEEWNKFYITMILCGQEYLKVKGMPVPNFDKISVQAHKQTHGGYAKLIEEHINPGRATELCVADLAYIYIEENDLAEDMATVTEVAYRIAMAIQSYCKLNGLEYAKKRTRRPNSENKVTFYTVQASKRSKK